MSLKLKVAFAGLILVLTTVATQATTIKASGEGWCSNGFDGCNNTDTHSIFNTFAGNIYEEGRLDTFRDWFAFAIPVVPGGIKTAVLWIWNPSRNFNTNDAAAFNVYEVGSISFNGLLNGLVLGSVLVRDADNGSDHYVDIFLNADGIAALNSAQGAGIVLGGTNDGGDYIFGYTNGIPKAKLALNEVPEPTPIAILGVGLFSFFGFELSRRAAKVRFSD